MNKRFIKRTILFSTALASMSVINSYLFKKTGVLLETLEGESGYFFSNFGNIYYVKSGTGHPLLLIHGPASGTSSFMWRKNFDELSKNYTVYAIDLPGFGKSQKLPITYTSKIYRNVIYDFINKVTGYPVSVIASSQSAAYIIKLDSEFPELFKKIIAVCPTGIRKLSEYPSITKRMITEMFKLPIVGTSMYNILVSNPGVRYYIRNKSYYNKDLASRYVIENYKNSSRQDGYLSKFAPASFLGGYLNEDISKEIQEIKTPALIIWGRNAKMNPVKNLNDFINLNHSVEHYVFEKCGYLPQEEYSVEFNTLCNDFLK